MSEISPAILDAIGKASGFAIVAFITILVIYALIQTILSNRTVSKQNSEETKILLNLLTENTKALQAIEKAITGLERTNAQTIGAIEAQGVLSGQVSNNLVTLEKSFRDHNNAVAETLGMVSTNIIDLEAFFKRRTDELLQRLDTLPADVGNVVKEHIAVMLLQSTPAPKKITSEITAAILAEAKEKPRVINGADFSEADKGTP